ncbi:MAG: N-6 DNA methylase, partial [Spirochaetes bacterium]|nr:N-6 DNA methylase [Spirochaetota bacterium]
KGTSEVDKEFLKLIETWRAELAKNIALRNLDLTIYELNYAVQKIIDRIIFLRIAEDKQMESYGNLIKLVENSDIYKSFNNLVENADNKYNSGLFDKKDFLFDLSIDDKILKSIFKSLYYPDCPYVFSVLGIEILGNIYEQFLGKTVRLTSSHQAKVEEKPEVKKAGGVYYTPQYIVDYIVYNTVGELIKNKKPQEIEEVKILDPACGSGSFLIGAYNYLLKYHIEYYTNEKNIKKALKEEKIYQLSENDYKLTIQEKQHILLNNIYGLDLDNQAVEVTKLSLLLKLLEAENQESSNSLFKYTDIKLLPDLSNNIKSGNSLINSSIFQDKDISLFEDEKLKTINVFDWNKEFAQIINPPQSPFDKGENKGGFDVVIGNPPYVKEYTDTEQFHLVKQSNLKKYYQGKMDLWYMFGCLSIDLLKDGGIHSFIATNNWITSAGASILRNKILNETKIIKFIDFADYKVFNTASIQTMIYIFKKVKNDKSYKVNYTKLLNKNISESELADWMNKKISLHKDKNTNNFEWFDASINPKELADKTITFVNNEINKILEKMNNKSNYKFDNNNVGTGIDVHQDFIIDKHLEKLKDKNIKKGDGIFVISHNEKKSLGLSDLEESIIKPYYTTENLFKYYGDPNNNLWVIYSNIEVRTNINNYPNIKKHLDKYKNVITSDFKPYGLHRAREQKFFEGDKIISLRKTSAPTFTYTTFPCYVSQTYFIIKPQDINLKYLTAFLNSKLVHFWLYYKGKKQGDQLQIDKAPLLEIPLIKIDDKKLIDKFIELVDNMIESNKKLHCAKLDSDKKMYQQKIDAIDNQINKLVYNLYGLNDEEIKVIESSV